MIGLLTNRRAVRLQAGAENPAGGAARMEDALSQL